MINLPKLRFFYISTTNLHGLPMIHRQIKNLHMFGRLMQYEKNL